MGMFFGNSSTLVKNFIVNYIDIDYSLWLTWCLTPLLVTFLLPMLIAMLLYLTAFIFYVYKLHWRTIKKSLETENKWEAARKTAACMWDAHGWIWHSYEVEGMENLPTEGPALIIYYHGAIPIDIYYFIAKVALYRDRITQTVADYFLFKIPGFSIIADCMKVIPGTVQTCSNVLKEGNLLAISPGGVYESQFSYQYDLLWKKRLGFARVALEAKAPIVPMFTENIREAFRTLSIGRRIFLRLYARFKFPFAPVYGGFPVKMITHLGKPIPHDPSLTPEELQAKVAAAISDLIQKHQRIPGSITLGILDRIPYLRRKFSKLTLKHED